MSNERFKIHEVFERINPLSSKFFLGKLLGVRSRDRLQVRPRDAKEIGSKAQSTPDVTQLIDRHYQVVEKIITICNDVLLRQMGVSAELATYEPHEGISPAEVIDIIEAAFAQSGAVDAIFQSHASAQVNDGIRGMTNIIRTRVQAPMYPSIRQTVTIEDHLIHKADSQGGKLNLIALEQYAQAQALANQAIQQMTKPELYKYTILRYVTEIMYLGNLQPSQIEQLSQMDSLEIIQHAINRVKKQFEHMLFHGSVDERIALRLERIVQILKLDLSELLSNPAAYAIATVFELDPFENESVHTFWSELDISIASIFRRLAEIAYMKAVQYVMFEPGSKALQDLDKTLEFLSQVGSFTADDKRVVQEIRSAYRTVENYIEQVMLTVAQNMINHAVAANLNAHNTTGFIRNLTSYSESQLQLLVDNWSDLLAEDFALGNNLGQLHLAQLRETIPVPEGQ